MIISNAWWTWYTRPAACPPDLVSHALLGPGQSPAYAFLAHQHCVIIPDHQRRRRFAGEGLLVLGLAWPLGVGLVWFGLGNGLRTTDGCPA